MTAGLSPGRLAAAAGVGRETLRYYERRGLLRDPRRTLGGHRIYPAEAVTLVRAIKTAQRLGFTLDEVAELLAAGVGRRRVRTDVGLRRRAREKLTEVDRRIAELEDIRGTLRRAVDAGCDDLIACAHTPHCPLPFTEPPAE